MVPPEAEFEGGGWTSSGTMALPERAPVDHHRTAQAMWAVVFAGGIGSRFWPVSSPTRPKPLLTLVTGRTLLEDTVGRFEPLIPAERIIIVTRIDIAPAILASMKSVPARNVLVEPRPLGTAAALAWGAQEVARRAGPFTPICALHADLAAGFPGAFRDDVQRGALVALRESALVALGVKPTRAEPSFGYLRPGAALDPELPLAEGGAHRVTGFVEKPDAATAASLAGGGALWHSGIVVGAAQVFLEQLARHTPELVPALPALTKGDIDAFARLITPTSIERGLLERIDRLLVVLSDCGWDDVGTWASLRRARDLDDDGNGALGDARFEDATSNVVHSEAGRVVLFGVSNLLVVSLPGLTFVTTLEKSKDLKPLLDALPGSMRVDPARRPTPPGPTPGQRR